MSVDFTKMPPGTRVETAYGPGVIEAVRDGYDYPVKVRLDSGDFRTYTTDGHQYRDHTRPTLFLAPFQWPEQSEPMPDLPVDTPVMVRDSDAAKWTPRYFARWDGGWCITYNGGATSFTGRGATAPWKQWRFPTEEELKGKSNVE